MNGTATTPFIHADGLPSPRRYLAIAAIAIGIVLAVLDSSVANIALPAIAHALSVTPAQAVWVTNAYQLAVVIALLPLASLGEQLGYRRVYLAGLVVFTVGSLACACSHTMPALIAARALQGLGGAGIMSVNGALVRYTYPQAMLGRGVGFNALVVSLSSALGPTIASAILAAGSWEWLFAVNVPIGIVNLVVAARALPHSDRSQTGFDIASAALNAVMFGGLVIGAGGLISPHGNRLASGLAVALAIVAGVVLFAREARAQRPLIPVDLLAIPVFALSVAASIAAFAAYSLVFLELPFFLETTLHRDQVRTGLIMTAWPAAVGVAAPIAGWLSDRIAAACLGGLGLGLLALGLLALADLPAHATGLDIAWRMAVCGAGFGLFQSPNNRVLLSTAPRARAGAAGGMLATARLTGMTVGATLTAVIFVVAPRSDEPVTMLVAAGLACVAATASLRRVASRTSAGGVPGIR